MKCVFCGADIPNGKDKCEYCGKFQHDYSDSLQEKYKEYEIEQKQNNNNAGKIIKTILKVIIVFVVIGVIGYFVLDYIYNMDYVYGSWHCTNEELVVTNITIEKKVIKMKNSSSGYREADYILERKVKEDDNMRYYINVSATKRLANGQDYVDANETKFELLMTEDNHNEFILTNTETNAVYKCYSDE